MYLKTICLSILVASGCAKIPPASSKYYLTKSSLSVDVTRFVSCVLANDDTGVGKISISDSVSPKIANSADLEAVQTFDLQKLRSTFTDPDVSVEYYDDGRLKGINATQTGTAKQILESSLKVVSSLGVFRTLAEDVAKRRNLQDACKFINQYKGNSGGLTLLYSGDVVVPTAKRQKLKPRGAAEFYHTNLKALGVVGDLHAHVDGSRLKRLSPPVNYDREEHQSILTARQLTKVEFSIHTTTNLEDIWTGSVLMALPGNEYGIPIPRRPAFGKQEFQVAFSDSGALSTLKYAAQSGASDAAGLAGIFVDELQGPSAAEQAKALQAEADLIKQRQRLAECQADPANCN